MGQIFLNGKQIATNIGVNAWADISLGSAWNENGPNVLAVSVQNSAGGGGILGTVTLQGNITGAQEIHGWRCTAALPRPRRPRPSGSRCPEAAAPGVPAFYRATFTTTPPGPVGPHPILRVSPQGLSHGSLWLNGHNLGRYPEKSPVDGLYLPESWLLPGRNTLTIFDEDGVRPRR